MATLENDGLLDRADRIRTIYEGTILEDAINTALAENDLERLQFIVKEAEDALDSFDHQVEPMDSMTPERAEAMYREATDVA